MAPAEPIARSARRRPNRAPLAVGRACRIRSRTWAKTWQTFITFS